jgi:hypothetical protein
VLDTLADSSMEQNQRDLKEKTQQLPLMGEIYSASAAVYVWLGEGTVSSDRALRYFAQAGFVDYYSAKVAETDNGKARTLPWAAAWSLFTARWSLSRHPLPFARTWFFTFILSEELTE